MSNPLQPGSVPPYQSPAPGQQYAAYPAPYAYGPRTNTLAIVSLVSAFVVSLVAVITGHIALAQIKRTGEGGRGLALAGLVIGYVGVGFTALFFVVWLVMFLSIMSHDLGAVGTAS